MPKLSQVALSDGRVLQIAEGGNPAGMPLILHSGTPGSHVFFKPWLEDAEAHNVRLISYDRPGYGVSTALPGRNVASVAKDVVEIARHLKLDRVTTLGVSGGGPHALACAALCPALYADLIVAAVAMESPAPYSDDGLNWFAGMDEASEAELRLAKAGREALTAHIDAAVAGMTNTRLDDLIEAMRPPSGSPSEAAEKVALMSSIAHWFYEGNQATLKYGHAGWIDDDLAFLKPWGFDVAEIQVPVLLMHGREDTSVPISHAKWLAAHIPNVTARYFDGEDHLTLLGRQFPAARKWLADHWP